MMNSFFKDKIFAKNLSLVFLTLLIIVTTSYAKPNFKKNNAKPTVIKLATLAPSGSPWHEILKDMAAEWLKASGGQVKLRIYPGGVAGDEADMVRKIRIGQLQAAAISNGGLSSIATEVMVLTIPMAVTSWQELDRVRKVMAPRLEALLEEKGFVVLNWGDAGWVRFFVPKSDPSVETVQKAKLFVWSGDDRTLGIWKASGFNAIPLSATDILPGLQTGMINAFNTTPIMALASQWFPFTPYMIEMPWAPMIGATVVSTRAWHKIPEDLRPQLKQIAENIGLRLQQEIRRLEEEALAEMKKRGLKIITPTEEQAKEWQIVMESVYPKIRGPIVSEQWFDDAIQAVTSENSTNGH
jgi:TRAP-type C4-dicarboxylate transport system substrate-binding protein